MRWLCRTTTRHLVSSERRRLRKYDERFNSVGGKRISDPAELTDIIIRNLALPLALANGNLYSRAIAQFADKNEIALAVVGSIFIPVT